MAVPKPRRICVNQRWGTYLRLHRSRCRHIRQPEMKHTNPGANSTKSCDSDLPTLKAWVKACYGREPDPCGGVNRSSNHVNQRCHAPIKIVLDSRTLEQYCESSVISGLSITLLKSVGTSRLHIASGSSLLIYETRGSLSLRPHFEVRCDAEFQ